MMVFEVVQNIGTIMYYNVEMTLNRYTVLSFMNYSAYFAVNVRFALLVVAVVAQYYNVLTFKIDTPFSLCKIVFDLNLLSFGETTKIS